MRPGSQNSPTEPRRHDASTIAEGGADTVDCVVIGAGVVGLAAARVLAQGGRDVLVLERNARFGEEISARNSEVIHAGIYYPPGSAKAETCRLGRQLLYDYAETAGVPHRRLGKLVVATDRTELPALRALLASAHRLGVTEVEWLDGKAATALEPALTCVAALWSPVTGIIDSHQLMLALLADLEAAGGQLVTRCAVHKLLPEPSTRAHGWRVETAQGTIRATAVVNAAGLGAIDLLPPAMPRAPSWPRLYPALGHYFRYAGPAPFQRLIYPLPEPGGLGIHATPDLAGVVRFGPDVCWQDDLEYRFDPCRRGHFAAQIQRYWPTLEPARLQPDYCGIRPKLAGPGAPAGDFCCAGPVEHGYPGLVNLLGIESPGLTAALAIAERVPAQLQL